MGSENRQTTAATTSTIPVRQLLGTANAQTASAATSAGPVHQLLGSANAETTPAAAKRKDPTQHAKGRTGECPGPRKETATQRNAPAAPCPCSAHCPASAARLNIWSPPEREFGERSPAPMWSRDGATRMRKGRGAYGPFVGICACGTDRHQSSHLTQDSAQPKGNVVHGGGKYACRVRGDLCGAGKGHVGQGSQPRQLLGICPAGTPSQADKKLAIYDAFCLFNDSRSGLLSLGEINGAMQYLKLQPTELDVIDFVTSADQDGDGKLSYNEWWEAVCDPEAKLSLMDDDDEPEVVRRSPSLSVESATVKPLQEEVCVPVPRPVRPPVHPLCAPAWQWWVPSVPCGMPGVCLRYVTRAPSRLATGVCLLRHDQMEQGPPEPQTGRSTFLLSSGRVLLSGLWDGADCTSCPARC